MRHLPFKSEICPSDRGGVLSFVLRGWEAIAMCESLARLFAPIWLLIARCLSLLYVLNFTLKQNIRQDKVTWYESLAFSAQACATNNDSRGAFQIVKKLAGFSVRAPQNVKLKSGEIAYDKPVIDSATPIAKRILL